MILWLLKCNTNIVLYFMIRVFGLFKYIVKGFVAFPVYYFYYKDDK